MPNRKRWPVLGALAVLVVGVATSVLGNRADAALLPFWPQLHRWLIDRVDIANWVWLVATLLVVLAASAAISSYRHGVDRGASGLDVAIALVELDETLFRLLAQLAATPNRAEAVVKLLEEFLRDTTSVLGGDVSRALVLRVIDGELAGWVGYQMPQLTLDRTRFPLRDAEGSGRGVALRTFKDGKTRVIHFDQEHDAWPADSRDYKVIDHDRPHPPYRSFVSAAVPGTEGEALGVLCFDSMNREAFDSADLQRFVAALAQRVAAVITIYNRLEHGDPVDEGTARGGN